MQPAATFINRRAKKDKSNNPESRSLYVPLPVFRGRERVCAACTLSQIVAICRRLPRVSKTAELC
jgi:hypothetical protein